MVITFTVPGEPQGKARAKTVRLKNGMSHSYTPEKTANYENWVRVCYQQANGKMMDAPCFTFHIEAIYGIPKSYSKKKQEQARLGLLRPTKKPDWDNIGKVVCDALNGIAWKDDSLVVEGSISKFFGDEPKLSVTITAHDLAEREDTDGKD